MKKQAIIATIMLTTVSLSAFADQLYRTQKLGNGQVIKWCKNANGKVNPCTYNDELLYMDLSINPLKYMTPAQRAQYSKNAKEDEARRDAAAKSQKTAESKAEAMRNSIIGNSLAVDKTRESYEEALRALESKKRLGLPINEAEYNLLEYKIEQLHKLEQSVTGYEDAGLSLTMNFNYERSLTAYESKEITQEEFQYLMNKLKSTDESIKVPYEQIKALTYIPIQPQQATEIPTANYASTQPQQYKENSNTMQSKIFNARNSIEEVNSTTGSLNNTINTGLNLIRSLTGH